MALSRVADEKASASAAQNFRALYYVKVGLRAASENQIQTILDPPVDIPSLRSFAHRYSLPKNRREFAWMLLLGLVPSTYSHETLEVHSENSFIFHQEASLALTLERTLVLINVITQDQPRNETLTMMYLLDSEGVVYTQDQLKFKHIRPLLSIAKTIVKMEGRFVFEYWLFKHFIMFYFKLKADLLNDVRRSLFSELAQCEPQVYHHLQSIDACNVLPLESWINSAFSGIVEDEILLKIWDKIVGMIDAKITRLLVTLSRAIISFQKEVLKMETSDDVLDFLMRKLSKEQSELIFKQINQSCDV